MKRISLILSLLLFSLAFSSTAFSQQKTKTKSKNVIERKVMGKEFDKSRGADEHIKSEAPTTDTKQEKQRGEVCTIYFNNYSGLYVNVYVDGDYMGTMSPGGSLTVYAYGGYADIYCKSTGGTRVWSDSGACSGIYRYNLYY